MIDRRSMLSAAVIAAVAVPATAQTSDRGGLTYVLVHGAYGGGWVWRDVVPGLEAKGHRVFTPTLTGLGDRAHLLSRQINIDTHVQDLANTITFAGLTDVILVGHSYGGVPVTGVADRMPEIVRHIVYLDALIPENGESVFDILPLGMAADRMKMVNAGLGDGPQSATARRQLRHTAEALPARRGRPSCHLRRIYRTRDTPDRTEPGARQAEGRLALRRDGRAPRYAADLSRPHGRATSAVQLSTSLRIMRHALQ